MPRDSLSPRALAVGDFNGDGNLDIAAAALGANNLQIVLGNGDGTFQAAQTITGPGGNSLAVGDFNGDGKLDLAVADSTVNQVNVLMGDGHGGFVSESLTVLGTPFAAGGRRLQRRRQTRPGRRQPRRE